MVRIPIVGPSTRAPLAALALVLAATACGGASKATRGGAAVLFPPLPNRPRLQFLGAYTSSDDVVRKSSFEQFVVGAEKAKQVLVKPYGAAMHDDRLIVADSGGHEVVVFDFAKREYRPLKGNQGGGRAKDPINVSVAADGSIWVADPGRNQVLEYGPDEEFRRAYGREGDFRPTDVRVRGDHVFVCNVRDSDVHVLDRRTGALLRKLGGSGRDLGKMHLPTNLAFGPDGDLYVSEVGNFRVQRMKPDGTPVVAFGKIGDAPGTLTRPKGVAVDPEGRVYVADAAFENVQIFDAEGRLLLFFGGPGDQAGNLYLPAGVEISTRGVERFQRLADPRLKLSYLVLVVSQYGPRRISVFGFGEWLGPEQDAPPPPPDAAPAVTPPGETPAGEAPAGEAEGGS